MVKAKHVQFGKHSLMDESVYLLQLKSLNREGKESVTCTLERYVFLGSVKSLHTHFRSLN